LPDSTPAKSGTLRHHLGTREEYWLKNLRKVARPRCDLDRVLMMDDESYKPEKSSAAA
jgi:hypothetical protein